MSSKVPPWELEASDIKPKAAPKEKNKPDRRPKTGSHTRKEDKAPGGYRSFKKSKAAMVFANGFRHGNSKYTPQYALDLLAHFHVPKHTDSSGEVVSKGRIVKNVKEGSNFPTIAGYCVKAQITQMTYHRWAYDIDANGQPKYPEFFEAADIVKSVAEDLLLNNSLKGYFNASISKFVMNTYHDKVEKSSKDLNVIGGIQIIVDKDDEAL